MKLTFYGHSCFSIEVEESNLLFDPFISPNELAQHIDISTLKPNYILVSHGHEDHVADVISIAEQSGATLISNFEIVSWFQKQGLEKGHPMNHGGTWDFDFGKVKYVKAVHSSTLPDGANGGNPGGFVVENKENNFYFSGDTALTYDMKLIGESTTLAFAILPIGDNFTMGISDAIKAAQFVNVKKVVGIHFDTFGYIKINHKAAQQAFADAGIELILLTIGKSIEL